jgi:Mlc titration factor MtfA (ptsG expression regulator)
MPPGDTIYIPGQTGPPPPTGNPHVDSLINTLWQEQPSAPEKEKPRFLFPQWEMFLFVALVAAVSVYFYIVRPGSAVKRKIRNVLKEGPPDNAITEIQYDHWLSRYNPYYNTLPDDLKKRFLLRTIKFRLSKEFRYHYLQEEEFMPVVISGAAVQLTFGLRNFLIEYFTVINVVKKEYKLPGCDEIFEGHVRNHSINLSWNNFLEGYEDYSDSENVGLHELAHAVSYDFLYGFQENRNAAFNSRFKEYIQQAGPVFKELRQGKNDVFDDYGRLNVEEFWAVSVETFFENPQEFREKMPGFYDAVSNVLNQDPLLPGKIINKSMAGLAN